MATEYGRKSGSYSTAVIGRWELVRQDIAGNYSVIRSHLYFYYGGSTSAGSSSSSFGTMGVTLYSGSYRFYPGETHLGYTDFTVYHNADGTFPATNIGFWAQSYHISSGEVWGTIGYRAVPDIPRQASITSAPDFNDEGNPTVNYSNPAGTAVSQLVLGIYDTKGSVAYANYRDVSKTGTSYTFNLTNDERVKLRQACTGNSMQVNFYLRTTIGGNNYYSVTTKTMTIVNGNPTFNNFEFEDVNSTTVALTGNNQNIIKGVSIVEATIPASSKASAKKEATMSKYRFTCGDKAVDIPYSNSEGVSNIIQNISNGTFTVYATDSRGNSTPVTKLANKVIDYSPLTKNSIDVYRSNGVSEEVILKLEGTIDEVNFGVKTNSIILAYYQYSVAGSGEWSETIQFMPEVKDGKFTYNAAIKGDLASKGFNISNSYEINVMVFDELGGVTFTDTLGSGIPNIALHKNGVGIMGKYDESVGGLLQVGGKNVLTRSIMTIYSSSRFNVNSSNKVNGLTKYISTGNKLEYSNSSIIIGKNVKKILISATFSYWQSKNYWQSQLDIRKNNSEVLARCWFETPADAGNTNFATISPFLAEVNEGDEIILYFGQDSSQEINVLANGKATFLTVEVIE